MTLSTTGTGNLTLDTIALMNQADGLVGAEISAFDAGSSRLFVTSNGGLQVVDLTDPSAPALVEVIDFTAAPYHAVSSDVTSVASFGGKIAVTLLNPDKTLPGQVVILDAATGDIIGSPVGVGNHPDMVTFTPDGTKLLIANEGELQVNGNGAVQDSRGSVSIIDVATHQVQTASFSSFDGTEAALRAAGVRIAAGNSASFDFEPEYIAVSPDGTKAMVTLQENNAVAILDIATATFTSVVGLGTQDFSTLLADFSDRDGAGNTQAIKLETGNPVFGLRMPDGIASYSAGGQVYYIIANEGDDRNDFLNPDELVRLSSQDLDDVAFPTEATLNDNNELGRLNILPADGNTDTADADLEQIVTIGARSFTILDSAGNTVFDSGDILERIQAVTPGVGNHGGTTGTALDDTRSDNKGPEPESVIIKQVGSSMYAFIALERGDGGVAVFDVTDPANVSFTGYTTEATAISPEGLHFIPASESPNGSNLLVISNEGTGGPDYAVQVIELSAMNATVGEDDNVGTGADDTFIGSAGDDAINGLGGNDTVDYAAIGGGITVDLAAGTVASNDTGHATASAPMLTGENGYQVQALLTNGETLADTTGALNSTTAGNYQPVGVMDGIGAFELDANTVRVLVNHELGNTTGGSYQLENGTTLVGARISYFDIDKGSKTIVDGGLAVGTVYDANGNVVTDNSFSFVNTSNPQAGFERLCSGQLVEANQFGTGNGITEQIYFTGEETGGTFSTVGGAVWALDVDTGDFWSLPAFGRGGWENVTQVDTGTTTHVAFILSDDTSPFNADGVAGNEAAPLYLYVGEKSTDVNANFLEKNGLSDGQLFVWVPDNATFTDPSTFNGNGSTATGTWVALDTSQNLAQASADGSTGFDEYGYPTQRNLWTQADAAGAFGFSRPEDVSTNPDNGAQFVLASTGSSSVSDPNGTVYTMTLDFTNVNAPAGTLNVLYDGNDDATLALRSPDNLDWADDGFIYVQEDDANSALFTGSGANPNEASIVRIDPATGEVVRVAEIDRSAVPAGMTDSAVADVGNWESSGILDVSALFGEAGGSLFLADVQAHSLTDGAIAAGSLVQGGQLVLLSSGVQVGTSGNDTLVSIENVVGTAGADVINGSTVANMLEGGAGNDALSGLGGNDRLDGDAGVDTLTGGAGRDFLTGGTDRDVFDFNTIRDSSLGTADRITDFARNVDDIDLSTIDANIKLAGNQVFKFLGTNAFTNHAGELRYVTTADGVRVMGDVNGDGKADFAIIVDDVARLGGGDFIL